MRADAAAMLHDTCEITRPAGPPEFDPVTGALEPAPRVVLWSGPCQIRPQYQERQTTIGDLSTIVDKHIATLPWDADGFGVNDRLQVVTATDSWLVGRSFRIFEILPSSPQINRRVLLEDQQREHNGEVGS